MGGDRAIDFVNKVKKKIVHVPICIAISDTGALYGKECLKNGIDYYIDDDGDEEFESLRLQSYIRQLCKNNQLQNAVEYAETNFETITEAIEDSIVMVDRHNRYLYMNAPHQMRLGVKDSSYKSKFYKDFHTIEENREFTRTMAHVFEINDYYSKEKEKDGRTYLLKYIPVKYPSSPQPLAVLIISSDITDRVRLERKLTESSSLLATTLESTSDGIFVADLSGKILTYNKKFLDLWAIPESIIEGRDEEVVAAYIEDQLIDRDGFLEQLKNLRENPERKAYDLLTFQDGRIFERLSQPQKMRDMIIGRTWSFRDVTEKRQISQNLNVTQANYKSLVESTGDPIFMVDEDGCYLFMNSHHQQLVGALAEGYTERRMRILLPPNENKKFYTALRQVLTDKNFYQDECVWQDRDWIRRFSPIAVENESYLLGVIVVLTDITERKAMEAEIKSSEERLQILFDNAPDGYFLTDVRGAFVDANLAAHRLTEYNRDDLEGKNIFLTKIFTSFNITKAAALFARNALGKVNEVEAVTVSRKDGSTFFADLMTYPIKIHDTNLVMTIIRDVTERKIAEDALRESEKQNRLLIANANEGIMVVRDNIIVSANPKIGAILASNHSELMNVDFTDFMQPEERLRFNELYAATLSGDGPYRSSTFTMYDAQNEKKWIEVRPSAITWKNKRSILLLANDITDRKLMEQALVQSNKKLNLLSNITRHDILNQITIILSYFDLLLQSPDSPKAAEWMDKQLNAVNLIRNQIEFTKEYESIGVTSPQWQNVGETVRRALSDAKPGMVFLDERLNYVEIFADPLIEKVFFNLYHNTLAHAGESLNQIEILLTIEPDHLTVIYQDDGKGVVPDEKEKIFQRGFGKNTGFGLYLSREILSITGLTLRENGTYGKGAKFEIQVSGNEYRLLNGF